jgi:hypothetical protein
VNAVEAIAILVAKRLLLLALAPRSPLLTIAVIAVAVIAVAVVAVAASDDDDDERPRRWHDDPPTVGPDPAR